MKTAIIAGTTGLIGNEVLNQLLERSEYDQVIGLSRRDLDLKHPKLKTEILDFNNLETTTFPENADIFCALGTTMKKAGSKEAFIKVDKDYVVALAKLGEKFQARNFLLVSSTGAKSESKVFYLRVKGQAEEELKKMKIDGIHIFRPASLTGPRKEVRKTEVISLWFVKLFKFLMIGKLKRYHPVHSKTIASKMIKIALKNLKGEFIYESEEINA